MADLPSPAPAASLERIERLHWGLLAAATLAAAAVPGLEPASLAAGGVFMGVNVRLMKRILGMLTGPAGAASPGVAVSLLLLKTSLFIALLALLFWRVPLDGLSFAAGATLFLVAAVLGALMPVARSRGES